MEGNTPKNYIGTSGWLYRNWIGDFYPADIKQKELFNYYQTQFKTVELNTTFYHLPKETTIQGWLEKAPEDFVYSLKASRFITHIKKLLDPLEPAKLFLDRIAPLGKKMGPILFQTPPSLGYNIERLKEILKILPKQYIYTFEFRNPSWFREETYQLFKEHNIALCIYDYRGYISPNVVTSNFLYIRLHGPTFQAYRGNYNDQKLERWVELISKANEEGRSAYCYFDNDAEGYAPHNAKRLEELLSPKKDNLFSL
jgi:uncharacterized protein YecE (DUF72 family)